VLSVIQGGWSSSFGSTQLVFVVRNNTAFEVKGMSVAYTVRDASGELMASGDTLFSLRPYRVGPGEIAFGDSFLSNVELPQDAQFEFQVESSDASDQHDDQIDLSIQEHSQQGDTLVAIIGNETGGPVQLNSAGVACFLEDGSVSGYGDASSDVDTIQDGDTSPVSIDLRDTECPICLISARGFGE
jgi:hypothetical protein